MGAKQVSSRSAFEVSKVERHPGQLYFATRSDWDPKNRLPKDQVALREAFDEVCAVLNARFAQRSPETFLGEYERLFDMARGAFNGSNVPVRASFSSLEAYKAELIRREGTAIKDEYLRGLAGAALTASGLIMAIAGLVRLLMYFGETHGFVVSDPSTRETEVSVLRFDPHYSALHFGLLLFSSMWGAWASFAVRNMELKFEQLQHAESDLMRPWSRLLIVGILVLILGLFFQLGIVTMSIGSFSTSQISQNALVALFVGFCLGFTEKALPSEVKRRITKLFQIGNAPKK